MANYTITDSNVKKGDGQPSIDKSSTAGVAIVAGEAVYLSSADSKLYKADSNDTSAKAVVFGIALNNAAADQPLTVLTGGEINLGSVGTLGDIAVLSATAGKIAPSADLASGHYVSIIGVFKTASILNVNINNSGYQIA